MTTTRDATGRFLSAAGEPTIRVRYRLPRTLVRRLHDSARARGLSYAQLLDQALPAHDPTSASASHRPDASPRVRRPRRSLSVDFWIEDAKRLRAFATSEGLSVSEAIRTLVTEALRARAEQHAQPLAHLRQDLDELRIRLDAIGPSAFAALRLVAYQTARLTQPASPEDALFLEARAAGADEWEATLDEAIRSTAEALPEGA